MSCETAPKNELPNLPQQTWDGDTVVESSPAVAMYENTIGKGA